ncbi:LacI family DNA-binding transcriptional regulator [Arthrobacter castelli]|uniref:LacI family DNA-binding transcriptional regulator n=1 Tax=Arthrobacter castelli TaxID=271431 RepID=UPI0004266A6A|nr:LacI family DNA-binding transcriptional regulator [Arthrobacter castelli]
MDTAPEKTAATLSDVAREAGVSLATASRSLNGSDRKVNESYRRRVLEAAERLGYIPNLFAQAVAKGSTMTVALLVADIADPYFSQIASGVINAAEEASLVTTIAVTGRNPQRELATVRELRGQRPRVMILAGSRSSDSEYEQQLLGELSAFEENGGHVAFISQNQPAFTTVQLENQAGAKALAEALVPLGYKKFAVITGPGNIRTGSERLRGFTEGLATHGVELDEESIIHASFTRDGGYEGAKELVRNGLDSVDLVFAVNDVMAVGAMSAIREAGFDPGVDIGVAGYDDIPTVRDVTPPLTTVRVPLEEVGRRALQLSFGSESVQQLATAAPVETKVVLRDSTPSRVR